MSKDISKILKGWDYKPDDVLVRIVRGDDGQDKIQLRVDMGVLQMEMSGRPDGQRPKGCESWLAYYQQKQRMYDAANPDSASFQLTDEDCARLWREGIQFYHRYLSFWHLDRYDLCARDTQRNLRLFAFAREYAEEDRDKWQFDQWRPYVIMMHTRAVATPLVKQGKFAEALGRVDSGIAAIRDFLAEYDSTDRADECDELVNLTQWREKILNEKTADADAQPKTLVEILRQKLQRAVAAEQFEEAARLRDEIRRMSS